MNLKGRGWDGMDWIHLVQDGKKWQFVVNMVVDLLVL
jgi:hypothetical protein